MDIIDQSTYHPSEQNTPPDERQRAYLSVFSPESKEARIVVEDLLRYVGKSVEPHEIAALSGFFTGRASVIQFIKDRLNQPPVKLRESV